MKYIKISVLLFLSTCFCSCVEKVIKLDLETASPQLVIDANIHWQKNTLGKEQMIKLSTTAAYYGDHFPSVSNATVSVVNSSNTVFTFTEDAQLNGQYYCYNFAPEIGEIYTLTVQVDGSTYTATETMVAVPPIEDKVEQNNAGGMGGDEVELVFFYQDDAAQDNNYLLSITNPHVSFPEFAAERDENNQGSLTPYYYSSKELKQGDLVTFQLYGISRGYYDYFRKLLVASGADTGPFPTIPSPVRGNIYNNTHPEKNALGYFSLSEVASKSYSIQ